MVGGIHRLRALQSAFGADSDARIPIWPVDPKKDREARFEAAKDNNIWPMSMDEWQGVFSEAKAEFPTQAEMARYFGVTPAFVSECLNFDSYRMHRNGVKSLNVVAPSSDGLSVPSVPLPPSPPNGSVTPAPSSQGEAPQVHSEIPPETGHRADARETSDEKPGPVSRIGDSLALSGSNGGTTGVQKSASMPSPSGFQAIASAPPLSSPPAPRSPLRALQDAVEALRAALRASEWEEADDVTTRAARATLAALAASIYDFEASLEDGQWTQTGPKPRAQAFPFRQMQKVVVDFGKNETKPGVIIMAEPNRYYQVRYFEGKKAITGRFHERQILMGEARA